MNKKEKQMRKLAYLIILISCIAFISGCCEKCKRKQTGRGCEKITVEERG